MNAVVNFFLYPLSPVLSLVAAALGLIAVECFPSFALRRLKFAIALAGALASFACCWWLLREMPAVLSNADRPAVWLVEFARTFKMDQTSVFFFGAISFFTFLSLLFFNTQFKTSDVRSEIFILLLFVACGMMLLVSADSLLMVFMALELLSLPTYVLVGIQRRDKQSCEAALKYFLFGSFATVLLVLGIALLYAQFGTLNIPKLAAGIQSQPQGTALLYGGLSLILIALGFKVGLAPFHMWVPDTYQGAPSAVTGFMGSAIKLAGFGLAIRVLWGMFLPLAGHWVTTLNWLAVITMFVGNLAALSQDNLKRMFAYSSVSHAGYLILGIAAVGSTTPSPSALYFYLVAYGMMIVGLFALIQLVERQTNSADIYHLSGLGFSHPLLGLCLALFAISGAGIPPTAGFFAKYFVFLDAVKAGHTPFVVAGLVSSLIGVYYYLRVIVYLYMKEDREKIKLSASPLVYAGILLCAFAMIFFSVLPQVLNLT